jgi:very-short-patch-repair endonuclease
MADGLLFRSHQEIHLYRALKAAGVSFAPLPVFVRGGQTYRRIEPDFVLLKDGIVLVVEVDGGTVHRETPVEAHNRTTMLAHEGAIVERISASECETLEKAKECASKILSVIAKHRANK